VGSPSVTSTLGIRNTTASKTVGALEGVSANLYVDAAGSGETYVDGTGFNIRTFAGTQIAKYISSGITFNQPLTGTTGNFSSTVTVATPTAGGHAINKTYGDATYAPIASPTFTGTPLAPNAAADTQTSQIATTSFVLGQASVANPLANGTAASGSSKRYSREDHVHPTTILPFSVSTDVLSIAAGGTGSFSYGASGVAVGDVICIAPPDNGSGNGYPDLVFTAYCWTANQINVNIRNVGSSAIDLPTITYKFRVIK